MTIIQSINIHNEQILCRQIPSNKVQKLNRDFFLVEEVIVKMKIMDIMITILILTLIMDIMETRETDTILWTETPLIMKNKILVIN